MNQPARIFADNQQPFWREGGRPSFRGNPRHFMMRMPPVQQRGYQQTRFNENLPSTSANAQRNSNQYPRGGSGSGYTPPKFTCYTCGVEGHTSRSCPVPCTVCKETGHQSKYCPTTQNRNSNYDQRVPRANFIEHRKEEPEEFVSLTSSRRKTRFDEDVCSVHMIMSREVTQESLVCLGEKNPSCFEVATVGSQSCNLSPFSLFLPKSFFVCLLVSCIWSIWMDLKGHVEKLQRCIESSTLLLKMHLSSGNPGEVMDDLHYCENGLRLCEGTAHFTRDNPEVKSGGESVSTVDLRFCRIDAEFQPSLVNRHSIQRCSEDLFAKEEGSVSIIDLYCGRGDVPDDLVDRPTLQCCVNRQDVLLPSQKTIEHRK